ACVFLRVGNWPPTASSYRRSGRRNSARGRRSVIRIMMMSCSRMRKRMLWSRMNWLASSPPPSSSATVIAGKTITRLMTMRPTPRRKRSWRVSLPLPSSSGTLPSSRRAPTRSRRQIMNSRR
ncbi:DNA translocase ftsK, partial [Klebsiella pneumoniae]